MATAYADPVEFVGQFKTDEKGPLSHERRWRVVGIAETLAYDKIAEALAATAAPAIGDQHPQYPTLYIKELTVDVPADGYADITASYGRRDTPDTSDDSELSIQTGLQSVDTPFDKDGNYVYAEYTAAESGKQRQYGTIARDVQSQILVLSRIESSHPGTLGRNYCGKVNSGAWSIKGDNITGDARSWKCVDISATALDDGTYRVTYRFEWNEIGWEKTIAWIDPETGRTPDGFKDLSPTDQAKCIKTIQMCDEADFNNLNL